MLSIRKFGIIVLVSNRIKYWSNYSIRNFEYSHSTRVVLAMFVVVSEVLASSFTRFREIAQSF